jgi:hypothetical protein
MIKIKISNKIAFILIAAVILTLIGGVVYAYNSGDASYVGHTAGEIEGIIDGRSITMQNCHSITMNTDTGDTCAAGDHPYTRCPSGEILAGIDTVYGGPCQGLAITNLKCCEPVVLE